MIKICLADDHNLIRAGLKKFIDTEPGLKVVSETNNPFEIVEVAKKSKADIIVMDLSMPGKSGLEVLKDIKIELPKIKILILSMHPEEHFAKRTIKAGAYGYLTKESAPEEIIKALHKIASGRKYVSSTLAEILASDFDDNSDKDPMEILSDREFQVLFRMAEGKSQVEIAAELMLSVTTVNTYRSRIAEKLNLKSNAELIKYAIEKGLVERSP